MAVYQYAGYMAESTDLARLNMLRLHMAEVEAEISASVAGGGKSRQTDVLNNKMARLEKREQELMRRCGSGPYAAGVSCADFRR